MKMREFDQAKNGLSTFGLTDIVFLLLVFFLVTFKMVDSEGDFHVRMPLATGGFPADLPLTLHMTADGTGNLNSMWLNEVDLGTDFDKLRSIVVSIVGDRRLVADDPEIEIDTDYNLRYAYVIKAITAVSGYKDGDQTVKLIEKVKFAKPRR